MTGVASQVVAFMPFSQNSSTLRWPGSGQAQLMQSKPSFWLMASASRAVRAGPIRFSAGSSECRIPGTPTAHCLPGCTSRSG